MIPSPLAGEGNGSAACEGEGKLRREKLKFNDYYFYVERSPPHPPALKRGRPLPQRGEVKSAKNESIPQLRGRGDQQSKGTAT